LGRSSWMGSGVKADSMPGGCGGSLGSGDHYVIVQVEGDICQ
jgi:hypothetical protein